MSGGRTLSGAVFAALAGAVVIGVPLAFMIGSIRYAMSPNPPRIETSPYDRRIAAEARVRDQMKAEYVRGYKDGLKARKEKP